MKKFFTIIIVSVILCGCGIKKEEYDKIVQMEQSVEAELEEVKTQKESLVAELGEIEKEKESLSAELDNVNSQLDELLNGAANRLSDIKKSMNNEEYSSVVSLATELHDKFPNSSEDLEAQQLAAEAQNRIDQIAAEAAAKKAAEEAEALKSAQDKAREIVRVKKLGKSSPNSAGGVDLYIGYTNNSDKVIKYITFTVTPYNAVGDRAVSEIGNISTFRARDTGPKAKGEGLAGNSSWCWSNAWYSWEIDSLKLESIDIEYMDGSTVHMGSEECQYVLY